MNAHLVISDLLTASGKKYKVDDNNFLPGTLQYIDRDYEFAYIPDIVAGKTHIRTAGNDKMIDENDLCFNFEVNRPVTVYVLYADKLRVLPKWLQDFRDTREKVTRKDSDATTLKGIFTLFAKECPAGKIELYGNLSKEMAKDPNFKASDPLGTNYCMYSVVILEQEGK